MTSTAPEQTPWPGDGTVPRTTERRSRHHAFTVWVEQLCAKDPGARSALRSGLRKDLDKVPRMHKIVAPWLPETGRSVDTERAYYAVASMIASQPRTQNPEPAADTPQESLTVAPRYRASLGTAFAAAVSTGPDRDKKMRANTAERNLHLLSRQSVAGLHRHLPSSIGYLRALGVPVDWPQLLGDLEHWRRHSGRISRRWLQDFYRQTEKPQLDAADHEDQTEPEEAVQPEPAEPATS